MKQDKKYQAKKISDSEYAKSTEKMKKMPKISGSASYGKSAPSSSMLNSSPRASVRKEGGIVGAGAKLVSKIYRNMGN